MASGSGSPPRFTLLNLVVAVHPGMLSSWQASPVAATQAAPGLWKQRGLRGTDRPRSYCSVRSAFRRPASRSSSEAIALLKTLRRLFRAPFRTASHQWHRPCDTHDLTRRPTRYSGAGPPRVVRWPWRGGPGLLILIGPIFTAPPRAPRLSSREADGLQLASSWTRDARIVSEVSEAGISLYSKGGAAELPGQPHATKRTGRLPSFNLRRIAAGVERNGPRWGSPLPISRFRSTFRNPRSPVPPYGASSFSDHAAFVITA